MAFSEPSFLVQGKYTSSAVLSALAILAEDPMRVASIVGNQKVNDTGIYSLHLCKEGVWRYVLIDDFMPVKVVQRRSLLFLNSLTRNSII